MNKAGLEEYTQIEIELKRLEKYLDELERKINMCSQTATGAPKQNCGDYCELVDKLAALKDIYTAKWDKLIDKRIEIETSIDALPPMERSLMRARYIDGLNWECVEDLIHYSERQVRRIHTHILRRMSANVRLGCDSIKLSQSG